MKSLFKIGLVVVTFLGLCWLGFKFDAWLVGLVSNTIPDHSWRSLAAIVCWIILIIFTLWPIFLLSGIVSVALGASLFGLKFKKRR